MFGHGQQFEGHRPEPAEAYLEMQMNKPIRPSVELPHDLQVAIDDLQKWPQENYVGTDKDDSENVKKESLTKTKHDKCGKTATLHEKQKKFPRKQMMTMVLAYKQLQSSIFNTVDELTQEFYSKFLESVIKDGSAVEYLHPTAEPSAVDTARKHFLLHLIATGKYSSLRAQLSHAVALVIQQRSKSKLWQSVDGVATISSSGKGTQQFVGQVYTHLIDILNNVLGPSTKTSPTSDFTSGSKQTTPVPKDAQESKEPRKKTNCNDELQSRNGKQSSKKKKRGRRRHLIKLLLFSQEAFVQGDLENAHRLHLDRIVQSHDSAQCWADFGVMWLARGDDRLAEVALREALLKDKNNLKALIASGMIAARHADMRALTCLGIALNLRPHCPEIMVLLAMAHARLGNEVASEYYFKKSKFVHRVLTGKDLTFVEVEFRGTIARLAEETQEMLYANASTLENIALAAAANRGRSRQSHTITKVSAVEPDPIPSSDALHTLNRELVPDKLISSRGVHDINFNHADGAESGRNESRPSPSPPPPPPIKSQSPSSQDRQSFVSKQENTKIPNFKFTLGLVDEIKTNAKFKLPSMGSCLMQTWNVTKRLKKSEKIHQQSVSPALGSEPRSQITITNESGSQQNAVTEIWKNPHQAASEDVEPEEDVNREEKEMTITGEEEREMEDMLTRSRSNIDKAQIFTRRVRSELLWTAHLLLKLRLFDFLDSVLARELASKPHERGSVHILYLRALSLHLRDRQKGAIGFLHEAIEQDPRNVTLWALLGHCYYQLKTKAQDDTFRSYEMALNLPHTRARRTQHHQQLQLHLVYLRFGIECLHKGQVHLAKKVFLQGIDKFSSPYLWIALGHTGRHFAEYPEAETAYGEANRLDNKNPVIWGHLSLLNHLLGHKLLAEQCYKWAVRYGLKQGSQLMNELQDVLHGGAEFQQIPDCIPHRYYTQRLAVENPLEAYKQALNFYQTSKQYMKDVENSDEREEQLKQKIRGMKPVVDKSILERLKPAPPAPVTPEEEPVQETEETIEQEEEQEINPNELNQGEPSVATEEESTRPSLARAEARKTTRRRSRSTSKGSVQGRRNSRNVSTHSTRSYAEKKSINKRKTAYAN